MHLLCSSTRVFRVLNQFVTHQHRILHFKENTQISKLLLAARWKTNETLTRRISAHCNILNVVCISLLCLDTRDSRASEICAHHVVRSMHTYDTVQQCFELCCRQQAQACMKSTKCSDCVCFVWQFESLPLSLFPTVRAAQLYWVCQQYQLRGSLQSTHSDCRVIL